MKNKIIPIKENENLGFSYTVTEEQIAAHQKLSIEEIFQWLSAGNEFLNAIQTPEEKERMRIVKGKYYIKPQ